MERLRQLDFVGHHDLKLFRHVRRQRDAFCRQITAEQVYELVQHLGDLQGRELATPLTQQVADTFNDPRRTIALNRELIESFTGKCVLAVAHRVRCHRGIGFYRRKRLIDFMSDGCGDLSGGAHAQFEPVIRRFQAILTQL